MATSAGACLAVFPAYFPLDAAVAGARCGRHAATRRRPSGSRRRVWVVSALLWWRRRWPNLWGPPPTAGLPLFAAAGAAMILAKFAARAGAARTGAADDGRAARHRLEHDDPAVAGRTARAHRRAVDRDDRRRRARRGRRRSTSPTAYRRLRAGEPATHERAGARRVRRHLRRRWPAIPIVSVHIGAAYSGTLNAARLGADVGGRRGAPRRHGRRPRSWPGCCVLDAADVAAAGGDVDAVVAAARATAGEVASVFTIAELDRAAAGGRLGPTTMTAPTAHRCC